MINLIIIANPIEPKKESNTKSINVIFLIIASLIETKKNRILKQLLSLLLLLFLIDNFFNNKHNYYNK